jgi:hypothetical protein
VLRISFGVFRLPPIKRSLSSVALNRQQIINHLQNIKISEVFPRNERNHLIGSLPIMLQEIFQKNLGRIEVKNDHISGFDASNAETYKFETPTSYQSSLENFIKRDALLRQVLRRDPYHLDSFRIDL